jgi:hypothetical protein
MLDYSDWQNKDKVATHIVKPAEFPPGRICLHVTLEVNVIAFLDVIRVEGAAQHQRDNWRNCGKGGTMFVTVTGCELCASAESFG